MIVDYFDNIILNNSNSEVTIKSSYELFFKSIRDSQSLKVISEPIMNSDLEVELFSKLKRNDVFNEIWEYNYAFSTQKRNDTIQVLEINRKGKYYEFLNKIGNSNKFIKKYSEEISKSGNISPGAVSAFLYHYKKIDFDKEIYRLIWAIHYITLIWEKDYKE